MIKRRTLAVAAATALLGGLGAYGTATAFAASSDTTPRPTPSATASAHHDGKNVDAMIRHCTSHLPADERKSAEREMREMMSDHDGASEHSMMDGTSGTATNGMMVDGSHEGSMTDMMSGTEGGS